MGFATHSMEYRQFLNSLVPDSDTLKAETVQNVVRPPPLRRPDILTCSRVQVMISPFKVRARSSTLHKDPLAYMPWRDLVSQFSRLHAGISPANRVEANMSLSFEKLIGSIVRLYWFE
jgi:hypothetical protein